MTDRGVLSLPGNRKLICSGEAALGSLEMMVKQKQKSGVFSRLLALGGKQSVSHHHLWPANSNTQPPCCLLYVRDEGGGGLLGYQFSIKTRIPERFRLVIKRHVTRSKLTWSMNSEKALKKKNALL